jgi:hypothetical protein
MPEAQTMTTPPARPKLYHITHVDNPRAIAADGEFLSDAAMIARGGPVQAVGMSGIKRRRVEELDQLDWPAIAATDFRPTEVKEHKQAEFLVHGRFPFDWIERVGVRSAGIQARAAAALAGAGCRTPIEVRQEWYF